MKYFTQAPILRQIGHRRLARLLSAFDQELKAGSLVLPEPDLQNDDYFADLATALSAAERLPENLRKALCTLENAASPENDKPLWAATKRRIPGVSVSMDCALDRALELWFAAPDEMYQFAPSDLPAKGSPNALSRRSQTKADLTLPRFNAPTPPTSPSSPISVTSSPNPAQRV